MHRIVPTLITDELWSALEPLEAAFDTRLALMEIDLIQIRRHIHAHPELSGKEFETTKFLAKKLVEAGYEIRYFRNEEGNRTGLAADLELGSPGSNVPLIAIRADMDALRIPDEKEVPYCSRNDGVAHACGHDVHATIVLSIALSLAALRDKGSELFSARGLRFRFLFQPAEEICFGAQWLTDQGAMQNVEAIVGLHVDPERTVGNVGIRYGTLTANCDEVDIVVEGHGGHAARPHHSMDPIAAAAHLISALYEYLPRSVDSRTPSVMTIGRIDGGYAPNVIPEKVELQGTLRTTDSGARRRLQERIAEICEGVAKSSGTIIKVKYSHPLASVDNHPNVAALMEAASRRVIGSEGIQILDRPSMGGEDFSVYLDHAPGALLRLGCVEEVNATTFLHSPVFDVDERAMGIGARIMLRTALLLANSKTSIRDLI